MTCSSCRQRLQRWFSTTCGEVDSDIIDFALELGAAQACGLSTNIQCLYSRSVVLTSLMSCEVYSVDTSASDTQADSITKARATTALDAQQQRTSDSNRLSTGHGESDYGETSYAKSKADMLKNSTATETGDGSSSFRDIGFGSGANNSRSFRTIVGDGLTHDFHDSKIDTAEDGYRTDCNFKSEYSNKEGSTFSLSLMAGVGYSTNQQTHEGRHFQQRSHRTFRASSQHDTTNNETTDTTTGTGDGTHTWFSKFQNDTLLAERDYDLRVSFSRSDTRKHAEAQAAGEGSGIFESRTDGTNAAQSTALSDSTADSLRTKNAASNTLASSRKNSQRFKALLLLHTQTQERIATELKKLAANQPALIGYMRGDRCLTLCLPQPGRSCWDAQWAMFNSGLGLLQS